MINYEFKIFFMTYNILLNFRITNNMIKLFKIIFILRQQEPNKQINSLVLVYHHLTIYILHLFLILLVILIILYFCVDLHLILIMVFMYYQITFLNHFLLFNYIILISIFKAILYQIFLQIINLQFLSKSFHLNIHHIIIIH